MMMSHRDILRDARSSSIGQDYLSLDPCEDFSKGEWIQTGHTTWLNDSDVRDVIILHLDEDIPEGFDWDYGNAPIRRTKLWLDGVRFDPLECWMEIVKLWNEKVKYILGYISSDIEDSDDDRQHQASSSSTRRLPKSCSSIKWSLSSRTKRAFQHVQLESGANNTQHVDNFTSSKTF